ncbi:MAG: putative Ig domain-containing protein, partial [Gemmatimonas sp.]
MWVDWNGNGDLSDAGDGLGTQAITVTGGVSFNISPPAGTLPGTKYMRLRAVEGVTAATFNGVSTLKGEVEDYVVQVPCPAITIVDGAALLSTTGTAFTQATGFAASGVNTGGFTWSLVSPPSGFSIGSADGRLSVASSVPAGVYSVPVRATAASFTSCSQDKTVGFRVCPIFTWTPASLPNAVVGQDYNSIAGSLITATGSAAIVNYSLSGAPAWLSITNAGQLQGTPTASAGPVSFTINATDANGCTGSTTRSITVSCPAFTMNNGSLMLSTTGITYTQASGFTVGSNTALNSAGYFWSLVTPPSGFSIGATDGKLTVGNVVPAGVYTLNVRATAASPYATCFADRAASYRVCPVFTWTPASLPTATVGVNYSTAPGTQISATGSAAITSYSLSGAPSWMSITSTGQLQGTPNSSAAAATFTINATDANGCTGSTTRSIAVTCPALTPLPAAGTLATAYQFQPYATTTFSTSGTSQSITHTVGGTAPSGMTWSVVSNVPTLTGTPLVTGSFNLTVTAAHGSNCSTTTNYSLVVNACPVLAINPTSVSNANLGLSYNQGANFSATGGAGSLTWLMEPQPQAGLVSQWGMESSVLDLIGTNEGYTQGSATYTLGKIGQSLDLDGVDDGAIIADALTQRPTTAISLEAWVYLDAAAPSGRRHLVVKTNTSALSNGYGLCQESGTSAVRFWINGVNSVLLVSENVQATLTTGTWNH